MDCEQLKPEEDALASVVHQLESLTTCSAREPEVLVSVFQNCESYMNWMCEKHPDYSKYIEAAESNFSVFTVKAFTSGATTPAQCHPGQEWELDENKRYNMFEHLTNLGALAYFYTELLDLKSSRYYFDRAFECMEQVDREKLIPAEYMASFRYVIGFVCFYASETEKTNGKGEDLSLFKDLKQFYRIIPSFKSLSVKAQAGVWGMKQYFWKMIKHDENDAVELARKVVKMDPEFYEWHYVLQACLRSKRRKHSYHHFQPNPLPSEEEKDAVIKANELYPFHPRYMLSETLILADYIKSSYSRSIRNDQSSQTSPVARKDKIFYKNLDFGRLEAVVAYIKERTREILKLSPKSVHVNTTLAEIFTVLLPHRYRDFNFGRYCLERCLATHPWSSKANHRMGAFFLNAKGPVEDMALAEKYFSTAVTTNPRNFSSLCALVQVMMRNTRTNSEHILKLLREKIGLHYWDKVERGSLHYLKGLVLFAVNRHEDGLNAFMKATKIHPDSLTFEDLSYQHRRYGWPENSPLELRRLIEVLSRHRGGTKRYNHNFINEVVLPKLEQAVKTQRNFGKKSGASHTSNVRRRHSPETWRT